MTYRVVLQHSEEEYSVSCPGLPGCWSQGTTEQEALENIKSAIKEYLAVVADLTAGEDVREVEIAASWWESCLAFPHLKAIRAFAPALVSCERANT